MNYTEHKRRKSVTANKLFRQFKFLTPFLPQNDSLIPKVREALLSWKAIQFQVAFFFVKVFLLEKYSKILPVFSKVFGMFSLISLNFFVLLFSVFSLNFPNFLVIFCFCIFAFLILFPYKTTCNFCLIISRNLNSTRSVGHANTMRPCYCSGQVSYHGASLLWLARGLKKIFSQCKRNTPIRNFLVAHHQNFHRAHLLHNPLH